MDILEQSRVYRQRAIDQKGEAIGQTHLTRWYDGAWCFLLSRARDGLWIFSAQLHPKGRDSIESDWHLLGQWAEAVGVPAGQREMGNTLFTMPNAAHKWMWTE